MNANALGLLRFVLAMLVVWVHFEQLTGTVLGLDVTETGLSHLAVNCFFVLSGFLMPHSFEHAQNWGKFYLKRFLRIYVSYFVVVTVVAIAAFGVSRCSMEQYFNAEWIKYYALNLLAFNFLKPDLSCLFQEHLITAVNGSLWSIKVEIMFYLCVPFLYLFHQRAGGKKLWFSMGLMLLAMAVNVGFSALALHTEGSFWEGMLNQFPAKLCFFLGGWYLFEVSNTKGKVLVCTLLVGFVVGLIGFVCISHDYEVLQLPICMSLVYLFFKAKVASGRAQALFRFLGGVSYALYLTHFPITQAFVALAKREVFQYSYVPYWLVVFLGLSTLLYLLESKILDYCKRKFKMD